MRRIFLHCVDSRVEEKGGWYARLHLGPFPGGLATTLATALRRTRLLELPFLAIQAVEIEGASHEYSRLPGVHEPVLDLLLRFREIARAGELPPDQKTAFFEARGPGALQAGDLRLPPGVRCVNPGLVLAHLAPGAVLRGRVLLERRDPLLSKNEPIPLPGWLPVTLTNGPVQRVGFRIEERGPLDPGGELVIFEISTNGVLSPQQALRQAAERLVRLFVGILGVEIQAPRNTPASFGSLSSANPLPTGKSDLGSLSLQGYRRLAEPLGLDLGNLDLSFETYQYFRSQGILTRGELLNAVTTGALPTQPMKEAKQSLIRFGLLSFLLFSSFMTTLLASTVGRRKTAVAQIRLRAGSGAVQINGQSVEAYRSAIPALILAVQAPLRVLDLSSFDVDVTVSGGGLHGQAEAIQLGLARALAQVQPEARQTLRVHQLLTRDAREKERRKYGLKKARKAPQFSKRLSTFFDFAPRYFVPSFVFPLSYVRTN